MHGDRGFQVADQATIADFYIEERTFPPSAEFVAQALVTDRSLYDEADADYEAFWARQARELLTWFEDFDTDARVGPALRQVVRRRHASTSRYNCLDRHVEAGRGDQVAYHWEGEPGDTRTITYAELLARGVHASPTC